LRPYAQRNTLRHNCLPLFPDQSAPDSRDECQRPPSLIDPCRAYEREDHIYVEAKAAAMSGFDPATRLQPIKAVVEDADWSCRAVRNEQYP